MNDLLLIQVSGKGNPRTKKIFRRLSGLLFVNLSIKYSSVTVDLSEKALLKGLALKDRQATEMIYREHYNLVQTLVINNNGTIDDARDIFQEAVLVLYEKAQHPDFELNCQIGTYLYSVARRLWLKRLQQLQKFVPDLETRMESVPVEEDLDHHERKNQEFLLMEKAMQSLGEPCRSLLEAYYLKKKNMAEIAAGFGYTNADNAKNQKYKCLTRLKKLFFAQYKNQSV